MNCKPRGNSDLADEKCAAWNTGRLHYEGYFTEVYESLKSTFDLKREYWH